MGDPSQNQVAQLTPPGVAAIATVRFVGPSVKLFAEQYLSKPLVVGRCVHAELKDQDGVIDDPLAVLADDNTLDLSLHGSAWIIEKTLKIAVDFGFEKVDPTSLITEKIGEIESDVLQDLPRALTEETIRILLAQPATWREMLAKNDAAAKTQALTDRSLHYLLNPPTVAIVGIPNVGKSTLANQLFARNHSITADLPGTTRDWVGERANIDGLVVTLIDTPGIRATSDPIEAAAIDQSNSIIQQANLIIELFDVTQPNEFQSRRFDNSICVCNKIDAKNLWNDHTMIQISASNGSGLDPLRQAILEYFGCNNLSSLHARTWNDTQKDRLKSG